MLDSVAERLTGTALMVWFSKTILESDRMRVQPTDLLHLLVFNILNVYVSDITHYTVHGPVQRCSRPTNGSQPMGWGTAALEHSTSDSRAITNLLLPIMVKRRRQELPDRGFVSHPVSCRAGRFRWSPIQYILWRFR